MFLERLIRRWKQICIFKRTNRHVRKVLAQTTLSPTRDLAWVHAVHANAWRDFYFLNCNKKFLCLSASLVDFLHALASSWQPNSRQLTSDMAIHTKIYFPCFHKLINFCWIRKVWMPIYLWGQDGVFNKIQTSPISLRSIFLGNPVIFKIENDFLFI